ncbi:DUF421 domain-containing protein [Streptomonospora wellingtoniae]|uniref:DUF421 domain-containing protein n=1 Tax=Streptomonospora wellingtoniae TaxID=3075544 RepID=A0ABU2KX43_9ACTN|nr:YetF domain-containing protein [Streptomonospora sp. DSM 45055]MDT0303874.1 DUF421 domain-containing protein [Streptomonospora sp. DSM 45055]
MQFSALGAPMESLLIVATATCGAYLSLVLFSRIAGLRSFSQMTNFDMAATVAFGSMVATTAVSAKTSLLEGVVALGVLFTAQGVLAWARRRYGAERLLDSGPLLLMRDGVVVEDNLARARMSRGDLCSKLRLAGVTAFDQAAAVVMESTGEVSVLRRAPGGAEVEPELLATVSAGDGPPAI